MRLSVVLLTWACHRANSDDMPSDSNDADDSVNDSVPDDDTGDDSGKPDRDGDGWLEPEDCDDDDGDVHPDAPEACVNHRDDDCDGVVDGCELELEHKVAQRFIDPDAEQNLLGFGNAMAFLERDGGVELWVSPQTVDTTGAYRAASVDAWPLASISGFEGIAFRPSMLATTGDFDAEGSADLVIVDIAKDRVVAYLFYDPVLGPANVADASASVTALDVSDESIVGAESATFPSVYVVGDMTFDGSDDLLFSATSNTWLLAGPITGDVDPSDGGPRVVGSVQGVGSATAVDFNADGIRDLATANPADGTAGAEAGAAYVYLGPVSSILEPAMADRAWFGTYGKFGPTGEAAGSDIGEGDFDGDGLDDLLIRSAGSFAATATGLEYFLGQEAPDSGALIDVASATVVGEVGDHLGDTRGAVADFDSDGRSDVVVSSMQNYPDAVGDGYVSVLLGPFEGQLIADRDANLVLRGTKYGWSGGNVAAGDLDGDGELELAIASVVPDEIDDDGFVAVVDLVTPAFMFEL